MRKTRNRTRYNNQEEMLIRFDRLPDADKIDISGKLLRHAIESIDIESVAPIKKVLNRVMTFIEAFYYTSWEYDATDVDESYPKTTDKEGSDEESEREKALKEIDDFYANIPELLKDYEGKYVAYADGKVHISGDNEAKVAEAFFSKFGRKPVCIAKVSLERPTYHLPSPWLSE